MYIRMGGGAVGEGEKKQGKNSVKNRKHRLRRNKYIILVPQFFCLCTLYKYLEKLYTLLHIFKATSIIFHGKCADPGTKGQIKPRRVWDAGTERPGPYRPSRPHVVTVNGTVYRLPSHPRGRRHLPYSSPYQHTCLIQSTNNRQDPYPTPCTLGVKVD